MAMKNLTYRNLMTVIHKIEKKGYDFKTSEVIARNIFEEFLSRPLGISIEKRIGMVLSREEFEKEQGGAFI